MNKQKPQQLKLKKLYQYYPEYQDSGLAWTGKIPKGWKVFKIKHFCEFQSGDGFPEELQGNNSGDIPFYKVSDINGDVKFVSGATNYVSQDLINKMKWHVIKPSSILMAKIGAALSKNHRKVNIGKACIDNNMLAVSVKEDILSSYLYWLWNTIDLADFQNISSVPSVNLEWLRNHKLSLPSSQQDQQKIAAYLDEKTALIEKIIGKKQRLIKLLKEKRSAIINKAVTKGLDDTVEFIDSRLDWIGNMPKNWTIEKLKRIGKAIIGLTYSPEDVTNESGTLVLRSSNIKNNKIVLDNNVFVSKKISEKLKTKAGDILICSRNGSRALIGKNACIDSKSSGLSFGAFMTIFRSKHWRFLSHVFQSALFACQSESFLTSTINQLTIDNLNNMIVVVPNNAPEREKIVAYLDDKTALIDDTIQKIQRSINLLQEFKTSLISHVTTGKIMI